MKSSYAKQVIASAFFDRLMTSGGENTRISKTTEHKIIIF